MQVYSFTHEVIEALIEAGMMVKDGERYRLRAEVSVQDAASAAAVVLAMRRRLLNGS